MAFSDFLKPQMKYYGNSKFNNDLFLTFIGILAFFTSSASKFAWGAVQDYLGFSRVYMIILIVQLGVILLLDFVTNTEAMYAIWIFLVFVCEGAHFVIFPAVCSTIYGSKLGSKIFGLIFFSRAIASSIGIIASSYLLPRFKWIGCFIFFAVLSAFSIILLLIFNESPIPSDDMKRIADKRKKKPQEGKDVAING